MGIFDLFKKKKNREIFTLEGDDSEMKEAIQKAQLTIMTNPICYGEDIGQEDVGIKVEFETEEGFEHIWCGDVTFDLKNLLFTCFLENEPKNVRLNQGDKIRVGIDQVTDWYVGLENGILGGYTLRVLRNRMSFEEKKDFDSTFPYLAREEKGI